MATGGPVDAETTASGRLAGGDLVLVRWSPVDWTWADLSRRCGMCVAVLASALCHGCLPDLGECDPAAAHRVTYTDDGTGRPAYEGQALINTSCGGGSFCHAERASDRFGAPAGLDFDLSLASSPEEVERLRRDRNAASELRREILHQVRKGWMPPPGEGEEVVATLPKYRDLPAIDSEQGQEILRNWLACGLPVVERTEDDRAEGVEPVGDVVAPRPGGGGCGEGFTDCSGVCVDTAVDPDHCGGCGIMCAGDEVCSEGGCTAGGCPDGTTMCSRSCVDTQTNETHCGGCDMPCPDGASCFEGSCVCEGGTMLCAGACVDTSSDRDHCGGCGNDCTGGEACEGGTCAACGEDVSFAADIQPIFTNTCTGSRCHSGARPAAGLDLTEGQAHGDLVGVPADCPDGRLLVAPGEPEASYLVDKLRGVNLCRGSRMPSGGDPPLSEDTIALIEDWICGGARND